MIDFFLTYSLELSAMLVLMGLSAFFSSSEAAFFSLPQSDRHALAGTGRLAEVALRLFAHPDRLLNSILLGNLVVNLLTFTLSTVLVFKLQKAGHPEGAALMALGTLFSVILFCEVIPKSLSVIAPKPFLLLWTLPVSLVVRFFQPILPLLRNVNILSRRLFYPDFIPEDYLQVGDLERAVEMSKEDAALLRREQRVLQNIVTLSDIGAEELMRPRSLIKTFRSTITFEEILDSLHGKLPRSGYCILTEPDSDEIACVLSFTRLTPGAMEHWREHFEPIVYVPWSASAAEVFDRLRRARSNVATVINEFGETIGILTMDDIIETIFTREQGRSRRLLDQNELVKLGPNLWKVNELTSLRRLRRQFGWECGEYSSMTVGGLLREILERFPLRGDCCRCQGFEFRVVEDNTDSNDTEESGLVIHLSRDEPPMGQS